MLGESWIWLEEWRVHAPVMESGVRALCNTTSQHNTKHHNTTRHQTSQHNTTSQHHTTPQHQTSHHNTKLQTKTPNITTQHNTKHHIITQTSRNNTTRHNTTRNKTKQVKIPSQTIRYQRCYTDTDVKDTVTVTHTDRYLLVQPDFECDLILSLY